MPKFPQEQHGPASPAEKLRRIWRGHPGRPTQEEAARLAGVTRPYFAKFVGNNSPGLVPNRSWVEKLLTAWGYPSAMVDWVFDTRDTDPPTPIAHIAGKRVAASELPDPVADIVAGRMASLPCWISSGKSEWKLPSRADPQSIPVPKSLINEGALGLTLGALDDSMSDLAEQGQTVLVQPGVTPKLGNLVLATSKSKAICRVLRPGPNGYELHFVNSRKYPQTLPADAWQIVGVATAVIKDVGEGRLNIDLRFEGIRL